jgi:hypothetical protein
MGLAALWLSHYHAKLASVTLMIARRLKKETAKRDEPHRLPE